MALLAVGALALTAAACGGDDYDNGDGGQATSTALPAGGSTATASTGGEETSYPLTVTDMLGRSVTIEAEPAKVAALSPTTVEYVYAVGGTSLTRSTSVDYPTNAVDAVDIGPSYQPSFEIIAQQSPDLIVADSVLQPQIQQNLESLGVPVLYAGAETYADALTGLALVGRALNRNTEAEAAVQELDCTKADIEDALPAERPKVLILNGTPDDFYAAKPESYVGDLASILQVDNLAEGQPDVGRFPGYTKLSLEAIVADAPEVILAITAGPPGSTAITQSLASNPAWASVPAVQNGRVHEIDLVLYLQAPGPRAGQALQELAALVYPDVFQ
jgi:iron complex transport system substrate-binding protein